MRDTYSFSITAADGARFADKTIPEPNSGCLLWLGSYDKKGYGRFAIGQRPVKASRVAWTIAHSAIPNGLFVLHKCDNPACVEVSHLFLGDNSANMTDCSRKGRMGTQKLLVADVEDIRRAWAGGASIKSLAKRYGIFRSTVRQAITGVTFAHVQSVPPYSPANHPLRNIPVDRRDYRKALEQAELLMQIALNTPVSKPQPVTQRERTAA